MEERNNESDEFMEEAQPLIPDAEKDYTISVFYQDDKQSAMACIFNFVNSSLGSGVLAVPYVFSLCGYILGPAVSLIFCALAVISFFMLARVADHTNRYQFNAVSEVLFPGWVGRTMGIIAVIFQLVYVCGGLISYTVVIRDNFWFFDLEQDMLYANILVACIMLFFIMPLTYLRTLDKLKFNSYLVIAVLAYIFICIFGYFIKGSIAHTNHPVHPFKAELTILNAFSLTIAGYNSQYNFLNLYCELRARHDNVKKVVYGSSGMLIIIYISFGIFGYLTYGDDTEPDILSNLTETQSVYTQIANFAMIFYMICHYPLPCYAMRRGIEGLIYGKNELPKTGMRVLISTCIVAFCLIIGLFVSSIDNILDFTSSLAGGFLGFIFPPLFMAKISRLKHQVAHAVWSYVYLALGVVITGLAFGSACWKWL